MEEKELDYILVPAGLLVMGVYHGWLLYNVIRNPQRTVIGINAESRHQWVFSMMTVSILLLLLFSFSSSLVLLYSLFTVCLYCGSEL